jgi:hypothetical protein
MKSTRFSNGLCCFSVGLLVSLSGCSQRSATIHVTLPKLYDDQKMVRVAEDDEEHSRCGNGMTPVAIRRAANLRACHHYADAIAEYTRVATGQSSKDSDARLLGELGIDPRRRLLRSRPPSGTVVGSNESIRRAEENDRQTAFVERRARRRQQLAEITRCCQGG